MLNPINSTYYNSSYYNTSFQKKSMPKCKEMLKKSQVKLSQKWSNFKKEYSALDDETKDQFWTSIIVGSLLIAGIAKVVHDISVFMRNMYEIFGVN